MQRIAEQIKKRAAQLLKEGRAARLLGWERGEGAGEHTPAFFDAEKGLKNFAYDGFCGANVSKYLIAAGKGEGKVIALLKPCDSLSYNQLIKENRVKAEKVYALGVGCRGMLDARKLEDMGIRGVRSIEESDDEEEVIVRARDGEHMIVRAELLLDKCLACKGKAHVACDEVIDDDDPAPETPVEDRFAGVKEIEAMSPEERFAFWRGELSRCIRCNACRNVCPACSCLKCVFDNPASQVDAKANVDPFEENMFHVIRAFHVAGRCTDCGECSRVCPQRIPLHLLNRKFIADINGFYGEFQAGLNNSIRSPLTNFDKGDVDPSVVSDQGGED